MQTPKKVARVHLLSQQRKEFPEGRYMLSFVGASSSSSCCCILP